MLHERNISEEISRKREDGNPADPAHKVIGDEVAVRHAPYARYKWSKGAHDGDKACEEDGFPTMLLEEGMRFIQVFPFNPLDVVGPLSEHMPDPVINRIPQDGCQH